MEGLKTIKRWLNLSLVISGLIFLWVGVARYLMEVLSLRPAPGALPPDISDLVIVFFGAATLSVIIFSVLLASVAFVQWQSIREDARNSAGKIDAALGRLDQVARDLGFSMKQLDQDMRAKNETLVREVRGRLDGAIGSAILVAHSDPAAGTQSESDRNYIAEALYHAQNSYKELKDLPGNAKYAALNSIVYCSCLLGLQARSDVLLAQGRELRGIGLQYEHLPHSAPYLLTYCRAELVFGSDLGELQRALTVVQGLREKNLSGIQKIESIYLVSALSERISSFPGRSG